MPINRIKDAWRRYQTMRRELWKTGRNAPKGAWINILRIIAISFRGVLDNNLFPRAAALSYYSLVALGPIVGIVVLVTGTFMRGDPELHIKQALLFVAPSMGEYINMEREGVFEAEEAELDGAEAEGLADGAPTEKAGVDTDPKPLPPEVTEEEVSTALDVLIDRMIEGAQDTIGGVQTTGKGLAGAIGGFFLIWIGISLLVAIENAFNDIWGVRQGRAWTNRIVFYWAVLSLGALIGFGLIGFLSASTVAGMFDLLPYGSKLSEIVLVAGPLITFAGLTGLLTIFYKFFPNTTVRWKSAFTGAGVVALLLVANNLLSILYIRRVITIQSLYGSVGIILVLMIGLYFFWVFLMLGGQITYSVQNVNFLANQRAWNNVSHRTRETITFATYIIICRRFANCLDPLSSDDIVDIVRVPGNIINESLSRLCELGLITPLGEKEEDTGDRQCYMPSRPLKKVTLASFRSRYVNAGSSEGVELVREVDPIVNLFRTKLDSLEQGELASKTIDELLEELAAESPMREEEKKAAQASVEI